MTIMDDIYNPYLTEEDVVELLRHQIVVFGSQTQFARNFGLSCAYVNDVLHGKRKPSGKILKALLLEKVTYYVFKLD